MVMWVTILCLLLQSAPPARGLGYTALAEMGPVDLEMVQLQEGLEAQLQMDSAVQLETHAMEGARLLGTAISTSEEAATAREVENEREAVAVVQGVMEETGGGFLMRGSQIFVSGTLRPRMKISEEPSPTVRKIRAQLGDSIQQKRRTRPAVGDPAIEHHLRALAGAISGMPMHKLTGTSVEVAVSEGDTRELRPKAKFLRHGPLNQHGPKTEAQHLLEESAVMLDVGYDDLFLGESEGKGTEVNTQPKMSPPVKEDVEESEKKILNDIEREEDDLELKKEKLANQTSVRFKDSPGIKRFKNNATNLSADWDRQFYLKKNDTNLALASKKPEVELKLPKMNITADMKDFVELSVAGQRLTGSLNWGMRRGAAKNFEVNPKVTIKRVNRRPVKNIKSLDFVSTSETMSTVFITGNSISRMDMVSSRGKVVKVAGKESEKGNRDGVGFRARFNAPKDVATFEDPQTPDRWMAVVADDKNDNLRLVDKIPKFNIGNEGVVTTVLGERMLKEPKKVVVLAANPKDQKESEIYTFVICGRRTIVRVENILKRTRSALPDSPYADENEKKMTNESNTVVAMNNQPTVHILSETDFDHLEGLAAVEVKEGTGKRWLLFATDRAFNAVYRLEHIMRGEQRAVIAKIGKINHPGELAVAGRGMTWFALISDYREGQSRVSRMDNIMDGEGLATVSTLTLVNRGNVSQNETVRNVIGDEIVKNQDLVSMSVPRSYTGQIYAVTSNQDLVKIDMSIPIQCKDARLLGSDTFQELGELADLGNTSPQSKPMYLYDWVAVSSRNLYDPYWTLVNYWYDGAPGSQHSVCGVATTTDSDPSIANAGDSDAESVPTYFCENQRCWPL